MSPPPSCFFGEARGTCTRFRCVALSCVPKNSSSVSCLRSCPNHKGSPVSKLLTTVMNFICLPSSTPVCTNGSLRRAALQRCRYRRSIARTVLAASWNCRGDSSHQRAFARQPHGYFKTFTKRRFTRQLRHLLNPHTALRTAQPIHFDDHRRPVLAPRQVAHFPFVVIMRVGKLSSAPRTDQLAVSPLAAYP